MKILFIGGTGMLGKPVARELIHAGFELHFLARNPVRVRDLYPGQPVIQGDVLESDSLEVAMQGMDIVYCNLSVHPSSKEKDPQPEREGVANIIQAARRSGIKRIAYLSSLVHRYEGMDGFHWWAFRVKAGAVKSIQESGIPYSIFYPSTFMETYPFQVIRGNKIAALGKSKMPMWFIAAEDYGNQVAASFRLDQSGNYDYDIQGPEPYKFDEANRVFVSHYTKSKLGILHAPIWLMKWMGAFSQQYNYVYHICKALNLYPEKFNSEKTWEKLGKPEISLAQYASRLK